MSYTNLSQVKTGDVLLFSGNSPTGFLLKTFVSSQWNHVGIAVRFKGKTVSLTEEGELYIYETNTGKRWDDIFQCKVVGASFSRASFVLPKYNKIACRPLHPSLRTQELKDFILPFALRTKGIRFPSGSLPFLGVWLGVPLQEKEEGGEVEMFCSELTAIFYGEYAGKQYNKLVASEATDIHLPTLFGNDMPVRADMFQPGHFSSELSPNACIFAGSEFDIQVIYADMLYIILQPLVIIIAIVVLIMMLLPR